MFESAKLPKTAAGWLALAIFVALAALGTWQASNGNWIATIIAGLGTLGTAINKGIWPKAPIGAALLAGLLLAGSAGCKGPYHAAWTTLDGLIEARNETTKGFKASLSKRRAECKTKHQVKTQEYGECIGDYLKGSKAWASIAMPALDSGFLLIKTSLQIAEKAEREKKVDWIGMLKPMACTAWQVLKLWGHLLPDKGQTFLLAIEPLGKGVCDA